MFDPHSQGRRGRETTLFSYHAEKRKGKRGDRVLIRLLLGEDDLRKKEGISSLGNAKQKKKKKLPWPTFPVTTRKKGKNGRKNL